MASETFARPRLPVDAATLRAAIRRHHRHGWSDGMVAQQIGCSRERVRSHRVAMGLDAVRYSGPIALRIRRAASLRLRTEGHGSLVALRLAKERLAVMLAGWPAGTTRREATVLESLRHGPQTMADVASVIGLAYRPDACWVQRLAARMVRSGLLVRGWRRRLAGQGGQQRVYKIAAAVVRERRRLESRNDG